MSLDLRFHGVYNKGDLETEMILLGAEKRIERLSEYAIADNTFNANGTMSNLLEHVYLFPHNSAPVEAGEAVALFTRRKQDGEADITVMPNGYRCHIYYWGLGRTVWNEDGDCAVVMKMENWQAHRC